MSSQASRLSGVGRREGLLGEVGHHDRVQPGHGLLAEVALRVPDRLADQGPGARLGHPAARVQLRAADQLVALEQVDEAMVGELRHQRLGDLAQRDVELQRAGQPLADPLEQADPVAGRAGRRASSPPGP